MSAFIVPDYHINALVSWAASRHGSTAARRVIRQNMAISLGTVAIMVLATFIVPVPLALGVAAHEGSTVVVVLNSLRLLFTRRA